MRKAFYVAAILLILGSCTSIEKDLDGISSNRNGRMHRFYATTEQSSPETKVYADEDLKILWNAGDFLSVFNQRTYNSKFEFKGEDGDNAGDFEDVTPSGLHSGNSLDNVYAVYPYESGNKINNAGNTITLTLPAEQQYKAHSFGIGANTMVAVTDDSYLAFKNLCGYLQLRLYGDNVKVSSITIQGNNGEKIAGRANVAVGLGTLPTVTMDETATDAITLVCDPPVEIGATADNYTDFWFVIPPTSFSGGFTITVTDELGGVYEKSTTKSLTIARSTMEWMSALQVTPNYDNVNVVFEDANFKAYCVENFDTNGDGEISIAEANAITRIEVCTDNITSLIGIERFVNLTYLRCSGSGPNSGTVGTYEGGYGKLTSLDLTANKALSFLDCQKNQLTSLVICSNPVLASLNCYKNLLEEIDISHNSELLYYDCWDNPQTTLDLSNNIKLQTLICNDNRIQLIDISNNKKLDFLSCKWNLLNSLDVSNNTALTKLECDGNQLTSLDVSNNTALTKLDCRANQLTSLDVCNNTSLNRLTCSGNPNLTEIWLKTGQTITDFTYDTAVATLKYHGIDDIVAFEDDIFKAYCLSRFDADGDGNVSLAEAYAADSICIYAENLKSLQGIEYFVNIQRLECSGDSLTSIDISHNTALVRLLCCGTQLASLDVSNNTELNSLGCSGNKLTSLDISNNVALTSLSCSDNQLKSLDISNNTALTGLFCDNNQLTSLDVSNNTALTRLECDDNQLTSLDIRNNTALKILSCYGNQLTSLDISHNTALTQLMCYTNQLTTLDVSNNTALTRLECEDNQLMTLDVSNNTKLRRLWCNNNPDLIEIWLKTGQTINDFSYDTDVATIRYKD